MATHVYWKLYFHTSQGSSLISLSEVQLRAVAGGANVAAGATLTTSSDWNAGTNPATNILDGNTATWWASNTQPASVIFQLTAAQDIVEVVLSDRFDGVPEQAPKLFTLLWADALAGPYTEKHIAACATWTTGATQTFDTDPGVSDYDISTFTDTPASLISTRTPNFGTVEIVVVTVTGGGTGTIGSGPGTGDPAPLASVGKLWPAGDGTPAAT